jgi:hypothetical protein
MARLNSRDEAGNLRLFESQGNVYPGGTPLENFVAAFPPGGPTPGNAHLRSMLEAVTCVFVATPNFDDATVAFAQGTTFDMAVWANRGQLLESQPERQTATDIYQLGRQWGVGLPDARVRHNEGCAISLAGDCWPEPQESLLRGV